MAMSGTLHLSCDYVPGYGFSDGRCFSNSAVSGRTLAVFPCSSCLDHKLQIKNGHMTCIPNKLSFMCQASSGGHRRNPDFSRQNKHGFRGRNRQNEERETFDGLEDTEMLSSKNGPILSLSNSPKFQATASPGPREREIVELFRKVQAQLRARAAAKKEEKRTEEASRGQGKESETVDSLLKLLRKHSGEQSKKKVSSFHSQEVNSDQLHGDAAYSQDSGPSLVNSRNKDHNTASFNRPASSFRRKSPVPRYKSQPSYSGEDTFDHSSSYKVTWTQKKDPVELCDQPENGPEPEPEPEPAILEPEPELKPGAFYQDEDDEGHITLDEISDDESLEADEEEEEEEDTEQETTKREDLSALKLVELRVIAKSQGVKGFSKMKKAELVKMLSNLD